MGVDLTSKGGKVTARYSISGVARLDDIIKSDDVFRGGLFSETQDGGLIPPAECKRMAKALRQKADELLAEALIFDAAALDGGFEQW